MTVFLWIFALSIAFSLGYALAFFMWAPNIRVDRDEVAKQVALHLIQRLPADEGHHEDKPLHSEQG